MEKPVPALYHLNAEIFLNYEMFPQIMGILLWTMEGHFHDQVSVQFS